MSTILTSDQDRELAETLAIMYKLMPERFNRAHFTCTVMGDPKRTGMKYDYRWIVSDAFHIDWGFRHGETRAVDLPIDDPLSRTCVVTDSLLSTVFGEDLRKIVHIEVLARNFKLGTDLFTINEWNGFLDIIRPKVFKCNTFQEIDLLYARGVALHALPVRCTRDELNREDTLKFAQDIANSCALLKIKFRLAEEKIDEFVLSSRIDNIRKLALAMVNICDPEKLEFQGIEEPNK